MGATNMTIRVILRDIDEAEGGHLLGDYPPSEVEPLLDLLRTTPLYVGETYVRLADEPVQFEGTVSGSRRERIVLEVLVESTE